MNSKLGLFSVILLGFNAIVGTGIFLLPNKVVALMGPFSLLVVLFDALLVICIALCFAEVSGKFSRNGGAYVYAREAFGEFIGFEVGIMKWAIAIIAWATMATGFAEALGAFVYGSKEQIPTLFKALSASSLLILLTLMNLAGIGFSKFFNNTITIAKLTPLIVFIILCLYFIKAENFQPFLMLGTNENGEILSFSEAFALSALIIFYAFTGFESLAIAAEDYKNPKKDLPRALVAVILSVAVFYLLIIGVAIGILGLDLAKENAPIAAAFNKVFEGFGGFIVGVTTLISIAGISIAASILTPRVGQALASDGLVPSFIAKKNSQGTPYWAIIITGLITLSLALYGTLIGSFAILAAISVISRFIQYVPTCLAVLVLRKRKDLPQSIISIPSFVPIIAIIVSIWLLVNAKLENILIGLGGLFIGLILYLWARFQRQRSLV